MRALDLVSISSSAHRRMGVAPACLVLALAFGCAALAPAAADGPPPLALVNGKPILEGDLKIAEAELGSRLAQLPPASKRRILLEYLIEAQIFADSATAAKLDSGPDYEARLQYWRRRALHDLYVDDKLKPAVTAAVTEADAKKFYDDLVKAQVPEDEVKASHILIKDEAKAKEVADKLAKGGDFAALAKEFSEDPGSKENGGDLGYFSKGQMVPEFEAAAFTLDKGKVSGLVKSKFGFHIIRVDDKRTTPPQALPPFDSLKDRITDSLLQKKAQTMGLELHNAAKIEYVDAEIKAQVDKEKAAEPSAKSDAPAASTKK